MQQVDRFSNPGGYRTRAWRRAATMAPVGLSRVARIHWLLLADRRLLRLAVNQAIREKTIQTW